MKEMTSQEAIRYLTKSLSMYYIAKQIEVAPISVSNYRSGKNKMGLDTAERFKNVFGIKITDASRPGRKANANN